MMKMYCNECSTDISDDVANVVRNVMARIEKKSIISKGQGILLLEDDWQAIRKIFFY